MQYSSWGRLVSDYERAIMALYGGGRGSRAATAAALQTPVPEIREKSETVARAMAERVREVNAASWREAAMKSTKAREMYQALREEIESTGVGRTVERISQRNAKLIRSVPREVASKITQKAAELHLAGERPEAMADRLRALAPHLTRSKIRLIARTEISRAETDLTVARASRLDIAWGQWRTSHDTRVRKSHRLMDKVLVKFSDPPDPEVLAGERSNAGHYLAGQTYNCRCVLLPLVRLDEIQWPAKVYTGGKIVRMTRAAFVALTNGTGKRAA